MHLKAIMIKERLLGPNDFEVGLSIGHLASLYNYHMNMYEKAEQLYLRSIQISKYPQFIHLFQERKEKHDNIFIEIGIGYFLSYTPSGHLKI